MIDKTSMNEIQEYNNLINEYTDLIFQEKNIDKNTGDKTKLTEDQYNKRMGILTNAFKGGKESKRSESGKMVETPIEIKTKAGNSVDKSLQLDNIDIKNAFKQITE